MRIDGRALLGLVAVALSSGCAVTPEPPPIDPGPGPDAVAQLLTGRYVGRSPGAGGPPVQLTVRRQSPPGSVPAQVELIQQSGDTDARRFVVSVQRGPLPTQLAGVFAPVDAAGTALGTCPLSGAVRDQGVVLTTAAASCRFGSGASEVGLVKEIAHDGRRLVIGDRVVGVDGPVAGGEQVLEFLPVHRYTGWAGRRDVVDGPWRRAEDLAVASDGRAVGLNDAGGMPLGVEIELAPYWPERESAVLLRLRAFDAASGALIGQAWADPGATRLGLAVGDLQVGLVLDPR